MVRFHGTLIAPYLMVFHAKTRKKILHSGFGCRHFSYSGICPENLPRGEDTCTLPVAGRKGDDYVGRRILFCVEKAPHILHLQWKI